MAATILEKTKTIKYFEVRCPECEDLYISQERTLREAQRTQERHDGFVHSARAGQHHVRHSERNVLGFWTVECICGYRTTSENYYTWKCPLDKTLEES